MPRVVAIDLIAHDRASSTFLKVAATADATAGRLAKTGGMLTTAGKKLTTGLTLPIVAAGVASAKLAIDFQSSMQKIVGLVGISQKQVDQWSNDILDLAKTLPQSPKELADALYFITSSGISASKALGVLKASAKAAAAGLGSTQVVADAVTSAINAYGIGNLSAAKATDILTAAVKAGKGEPEDLAAAIGRVIAPAQDLGVSFDQVAAAMSSMTLIGLDANESATALRGVLTSLQRPTAKQGEALKNMGLSLAQVRDIVAKQGLLPALKLLAERSQGNVEATAALFGNVRALNGFLALTGKNAKNTAQVFDDLKNSTGATDRAFDAASKTAKFKLQSALTSLQVAAIKFGNVLLPAAAGLARFFAGIADKFGKLPGPLQKIIVDAALALAALGPVLFIIGKALKLVAALRIGFLGLRTYIFYATTAMRGFAVAEEGAAVAGSRLGLGPMAGKLGVLTKTLGAVAAAFLVMQGTAKAAANEIGPGASLARNIDDQTAVIKTMAGAFDTSFDMIKKGVSGSDEDFKKFLDTLKTGPDGGKVKNFAVILGDLHKVLKGTDPAATAAANATGKAAAANGKAAAAASGNAAATQKATTAQQQAKITVDGVTTAITKEVTASGLLKSAFDRLNGTALGLEETQNTFLDTLSQLKSSIHDNGKGLNRFSDKGRANREVFVQLIQAANDHAQAVADDTASTKGLTAGVKAGVADLKNHEAAIRRAAVAAGLDKDQVDKLIRSLGKVPKTVSSNVSTPGADKSKKKVDDVRAAVERLPNGKGITVTANTGAAEARLQNLRNILGRLANANINIGSSVGANGNIHILGGGSYAKGGMLQEGWSTVGEAGWERIYKRGNQVQVFPQGTGPAETGAGRSGPLVKQEIYAQPGQSAQEIGDISASRITFALKSR